jgi:hypothetical protein
MKALTKISLFFIPLLALALPSTTFAKGLMDDQVVFGNTFILRSGDVLDGNLIVFGGNVELESGSMVDGDVVVFGGIINADGLITGSVVGLGGPVYLGGTAVVEGEVVSAGSPINQSAGAVIEGEIVDLSQGPFLFDFPGGVQTWPDGTQLPRMDWGWNPLVRIVHFLLWLIVGAVVATLMLLFVPDHTERVAYAAVNSPLHSLGIGLLVAVVFVPLVIILSFVMIILLITICLLPFFLLVVIFAAVLAWAFGLIALGYEVGMRLNKGLNRDWAPPVSAGIGTFLLLLVVYGLEIVIPCVGWTFPALVGLLGLGAVLLSRFGTRIYPQSYPASAKFETANELPPSAGDEDTSELSA